MAYIKINLEWVELNIHTFSILQSPFSQYINSYNYFP
jgi:hypothetical protein